ncbi:MAG TPA: M23 family metallopeptidase [bacterium]|nr:M23 family metallopeptidase [bacterium]HPN43312.1 M23 family metallopeptidase [bacterium]
MDKVRDMQHTRLKMMSFSLGASSVKQIILDWKKIFLTFFFVSIILVILFIQLLRLLSYVYSDWKIVQLKKSNNQLADQLVNYNNKMQQLCKIVSELEQKDDDLRVFVDLPTVNMDIRRLGVGGQSNETFTTYSSISEELVNLATTVDQEITNLTQRVDLLTTSRKAIKYKYNQNVTLLKSTPSIHPVKNARMGDQFGYRTDPFTWERKHHNGVDLVAPRGADVLATAEGTVLEAVSRYTPNQLRGKYIIIDHNNGFFTKYAHLSKVLVKPGQKVTRYTLIGKVGDTGRATGPHLHYEVIQNDVNVNPKSFFLD